MNDLFEAVDNIIKCINRETSGFTVSERAMVLLYVNEMCKVTVELDALDALRPRKNEES